MMNREVHWLRGVVIAVWLLSCSAGSQSSSGGAPGGSPSAGANQGVAGALLVGGAGGTSGGGRSGAGAGGSVVAGESGANDAGSAAESEPPLRTVSFVESDENIANPERGFHGNGQTQSDASCAFSGLPTPSPSGDTLIRVYARLDAFRDSPLSSACLSALDQMLANVRSAGLKLVLRFSYNFCQGAGCLDASQATILSHIVQLTPLLAKNSDVIATLQAGFIGAWGEWHDSTNNLTNLADERAILEAELQALPASRMLQIRYPAAKKAIYGGPFAAGVAFSAMPAARIGHHNDCFLASDDDLGTYDPPPIQPWKDYIAAESAFTVVGAETCAVNPPRSDCATALSELAALHVSYLNREFDADVVSAWAAQGCLPQIEKNLGYRLVLRSASLPASVRPGGVLRLSVTLHDVGYASVYNPRPVYVTLSSGQVRLSALLAQVDPRRWQSGTDASFETRLRVPANLSPGGYRVSLWLPDAASGLAARAEYSLRFANQATWLPQTADNLLALVSVDPSAPGAVDSTALELREIP